MHCTLGDVSRTPSPPAERYIWRPELSARRCAAGPCGADQRTRLAAAACSFYPGASLGSSGHPFICAPPCKYAAKPRGCKEGFGCQHCHQCRWSASQGAHRRQQREVASAPLGSTLSMCSAREADAKCSRLSAPQRTPLNGSAEKTSHLDTVRSRPGSAASMVRKEKMRARRRKRRHAGGEYKAHTQHALAPHRGIPTDTMKWGTCA